MTKEQELEIPDEAIKFIVNNYLRRSQVAGISVSIGISPLDVESVISLFFRWAKLNGNLKDNIIDLEKLKEK